MEKYALEFFFETLIDYAFNNQLVIDKGTYLTIVIGQITVYAILLTFYQFIVSFQGTNDRSVLKYLGINLIEYFVNKRLVIYNRIISKPLFGLLFILEILYKPIISIYGNEIPDNMITVFNFIWYTYVVFFFVVFVVLFFQCTRCVLSIKTVIDRRRNANIIRCINKDFRKKTFVELLKKSSIEMLMDDMKYLRYTIAEDGDSKLQVEYSKLIIDIFKDYEKRKEKEITLLLTKNKKVKNQIAWIYNMNNECWLLSEFIKGKYIQVDHLLEKYIQDLHLRLLNLNLKRALADEYEKIAIDIFDSNEDSLDCREWKVLTEEIFEKCVLKDKKRMIETLYSGYHSGNRLFKKYCEKTLLCIMRKFIWEVFEDKRQQKDFVYVFEYVLRDDEFNDFYASEVCDNLISYNKINVAELIKLLNKENCTYIFVYLVIYYSIYKFRFEWKNINITMLKELIRNGKSLESEFERINSIISNSRIDHRYSDDMYIALVENLHKEITGKWLEEIYQQKSIDAFYVTIIKLCVFEQTYCSFYQEGGIEAKISFINELAKHKEVLLFDNVKKMFLQMQYNDFRELGYWPEKLHITLRSLLLMNMGISDELLDDKIQYLHYTSVGQYLLIKHAGENSISEVKSDLIRKAYVASNMSIQEYVEHLYSECCICGVELSYVMKEKMKSYLMEVI